MPARIRHQHRERHTALPDEAEVTAARHAVARHRRRRHTNQVTCGFCGGRWRLGTTYTGKPAPGCFRRRQALDVLDVAGCLCEDGMISR